MSKKFLITIALAAPLLISGGYFIWQRQQAIPTPTSVVTELYTFDPAVDIPVQTESVPELAFSSQHITAIPGSNQVWYEIPEMGIKLLFPKEGAEDTVYRYSITKGKVIISVDPKTEAEEWVENVSFITLFSKQVINYNQHCDTPLCGTDAFERVIQKVPGIYHNQSLAFGSKFIKQFEDFYLITGGSPQAVPFANPEEERKFYQTVHFPSVPPLTKMHIDLLESE